MPDPGARRPLLAVLAVPLAAVLLLAGTALYTQDRDNRRLLDAQVFAKRAIAAGHATASLLNLARGVESLPLALAPEQRHAWQALADSEAGRLEQFLDDLSRNYIFEASLDDLRHLRAVLAEYRGVHAEVLTRSEAQKPDEATAAAMRGAPLVAQMQASLRAIKERAQHALGEIEVTAAKDAVVAWTVTLGVAIGGTVLSLALSLWIVLRGAGATQVPGNAAAASRAVPARTEERLGSAILGLDEAARRLTSDIDGFLQHGEGPGAGGADARLLGFTAAAKELAAAAGAITREVSEATAAARRAAAGVEVADASMASLNEAALRIGTAMRRAGRHEPAGPGDAGGELRSPSEARGARHGGMRG